MISVVLWVLWAYAMGFCLCILGFEKVILEQLTDDDLEMLSPNGWVIAESMLWPIIFGSFIYRWIKFLFTGKV